MANDRYVLRGVTSWGQGCAYEGYPGVYGRVQSVISWIEDTMENKARLLAAGCFLLLVDKTCRDTLRDLETVETKRLYIEVYTTQRLVFAWCSAA